MLFLVSTHPLSVASTEQSKRAHLRLRQVEVVDARGRFTQIPFDSLLKYRLCFLSLHKADVTSSIAQVSCHSCASTVTGVILGCMCNKPFFVRACKHRQLVCMGDTFRQVLARTCFLSIHARRRVCFKPARLLRRRRHNVDPV